MQLNEGHIFGNANIHVKHGKIKLCVVIPVGIQYYTILQYYNWRIDVPWCSVSRSKIANSSVTFGHTGIIILVKKNVELIKLGIFNYF